MTQAPGLPPPPPAVPTDALWVIWQPVIGHGWAHTLVEVARPDGVD